MANLKMVRYKTDWCPFCQRTKTMFDQLSENNPHISFEIIDLGDYSDDHLFYEYRLDVVPSYRIYDNDNEVYFFNGPTSKELLQAKLDELSK